MNLYKHWTRETAVIILVTGIAFGAAGLIAGLLAHEGSSSAYLTLVGIATGISIAMIAIAIIWLVKWRGKTNDQIRAELHQVFDERYYSAQARASLISAHVTVTFLLVCAIVFAVQHNLLVTWLFIGATYIVVFGRLLLTRLLLRNS